MQLGGHDVARCPRESAMARAIELWHRYSEDFGYLMHHRMRVDRLFGRAPLLRGRGLASRTRFFGGGERV